jgi:uncharacterized protein (TIGR03435 family)
MAIKYVLLLVVAAIPGVLQTPTALQRQFEVVSIKRNNSGSRALNFGSSPGRFNGRNLTLRMLITYAYKIQDFQLTGGPAWINNDRYDIEAKASDSATSDEINGSMLQRMLEDRFMLSVRREIQDRPVYVLNVAKTGSRLKSGQCIAPDPNAPASRRPEVCGFTVMDTNMIRATHVDMSRFIPMLTVWVQRTIVDRTGFTGTFDVDLKWNPNETAVANVAPTADAAPSIFTALEEQLGLKLESARGPVEVLVIDRAEKPTEN